MPHRFESLIIRPLFEFGDSDQENQKNYQEVIKRTLKAILPAEFFEKNVAGGNHRLHQQQILQKIIPLITRSKKVEFPGTLSFFSLSKLRQNSFKFFFEMISHWLTPGRRLNVVLVYAADFGLPQLSEETFTICEVMIKVADQAEHEEMTRNFPLIQSELTFGMHSEFYAQRILEIRGLSADDKIALIQAFIASLVKRFPHDFNTEIFIEMQALLVTCRDEFKARRQPRHLSRMITIRYLFRKRLREGMRKNPTRRHICLKVFRADIQMEASRKPVLCIFVGVNLLRDQENFGERHLLRAIQHYIPASIPIEHSFFHHRLDSENLCFSYLEVEKRDGSLFTEAEIKKLRRELPGNIKNRIEHRLHNVFMPRNEEEVMRNILTLTNQIKYVRDLPQVLINYDEQAYAHLYFTVILARLLKTGAPSVADLFKRVDTPVEYLHDRTKIMGFVRKKYPKEATVFRLKLPKEGFLRADQSIDLYKARQSIVKELSKVIGEIRDYNGGMISKQHELLLDIRKALGDTKDYDDLLLENFFYSLAPVVARALIDPEAFKKLFLMLLEGIKEYKQEGYYLKFDAGFRTNFALIIVEDVSVKDNIHRAIQDLHIPSAELACAHVKHQGNICLGYMCCVSDPLKQEQFFKIISETLRSSFAL